MNKDDGCSFCNAFDVLIEDLQAAALKFSRACGETVECAHFYYDRTPLMIDIDLGDRYGTAAG